MNGYIVEYQTNARNRHIHLLAKTLGCDEEKLITLMSLQLTEANLDEYGRFSDLRKTVDKEKAKQYFERVEQKPLMPREVSNKTNQLLRDFVLKGGYEIENPEAAT